MEGQENEKKEMREPQKEIYSQTLRAGKRTYFFDVRSTQSDDYYLTITESKKRFNNQQGKFHYEKHKIFLYKEDFENFMESFSKTVKFIVKERPNIEKRLSPEEYAKVKAEQSETNKFADVDFDELGSSNKKESSEESEKTKE